MNKSVYENCIPKCLMVSLVKKIPKKSISSHLNNDRQSKSCFSVLGRNTVVEKERKLHGFGDTPVLPRDSNECTICD